MEIKQNLFYIAPQVKTPFEVVGGVAPYTYSAVNGEISSNGVYTAPDTLGIDTITVIDDNAEEVTATITVCEVISLVCAILQHELALGDDQVYIYNQRITLPNDSRLYIAVGVTNCQPFSNIRNTQEVDGVLSEVQNTNFKATLSVDILSKSMDALYKKELVVMALNSLYSNQIQEANNFSIGYIPAPFSNLSENEGPAILNRFNLSVNVMYNKTRISPIEYFNSFEDIEITTNE